MSHKYEPRYDLGTADVQGFKVEGISLAGLRSILETLCTRTYVRDVCIKCGHIIERQKDPCT